MRPGHGLSSTKGYTSAQRGSHHRETRTSTNKTERASRARATGRAPARRSGRRSDRPTRCAAGLVARRMRSGGPGLVACAVAPVGQMQRRSRDGCPSIVALVWLPSTSSAWRPRGLPAPPEVGCGKTALGSGLFRPRAYTFLAMARLDDTGMLQWTCADGGPISRLSPGVAG